MDLLYLPIIPWSFFSVKGRIFNGKFITLFIYIISVPIVYCVKCNKSILIILSYWSKFFSFSFTEMVIFSGADERGQNIVQWKVTRKKLLQLQIKLKPCISSFDSSFYIGFNITLKQKPK